MCCIVSMHAERSAIALRVEALVSWQGIEVNYVQTRARLLVVPIAIHVPPTLRNWSGVGFVLSIWIIPGRVARVCGRIDSLTREG